MRLSIYSVLALASWASADAVIAKRQTSTTSKEFSQGGCRDIMFAFARGSTEVGNMGTVCGPPTSNGLKEKYGNAKVATEGIDYAAGLGTNALPGGADPEGIANMKSTLTNMATKCPNSILVAGGYSQGAAVAHGAIKALPSTVQDKIVGVVTFGDTQKVQDNNQIPNFPKDKLLIICNPGDAVCLGTLTVLPPHLAYGARVPEAVDFLSKKIDAAMK